MTDARHSLTIAIAATATAAVDLALDASRAVALYPPVTLAADSRDRDDVLAAAKSRIGRLTSGQIRTVRRPSAARRLGGLLPSPEDWLEVDRTGRGGQFGSVRVPRRLASTASLVGLAAAPEPRRLARPPMMAFWAGFADPRQATVALMAGPLSGLVAELAFAFSPRLNLLVGQRGTMAFAIVSDDILATDLGWLALAPTDPQDESFGPWEHPAIQHAATMGFGVPGPDALYLRVLARSDHDAIRQRVESDVRLALGLPLAGTHG